MSEHGSQPPDDPGSFDEPVMSRLQARFEDLDDGLDLPLPDPTGGASSAGGPPTMRSSGNRFIDDLNVQLEVLRQQLDDAFDDMDRRVDEAETRASVAEARASVAEARASVAETRAGDAETRVVEIEERIAEMAALLAALAPDDEPPSKEAPGASSLRSALERLRERRDA